MRTKLLLLLLVIFQISFGQQRTCGMQEHMNQMMFNPVFKKQYEERQAKFQVEYQKLIEKQLAKKNGNVVEYISHDGYNTIVFRSEEEKVYNQILTNIYKIISNYHF